MDPSDFPHNPSIRACILPSIHPMHSSIPCMGLFIHAPLHSIIHHSTQPSIYPSTHPSLHTYIHASILPSTHSPIHPHIHLCIQPSIILVLCMYATEEMTTITYYRSTHGTARKSQRTIAATRHSEHNKIKATSSLFRSEMIAKKNKKKHKKPPP